MFQRPFSFEGRIRRMEFGFSLLIYFVAAMILSILIEIEGTGQAIAVILYIPLVWFSIAQATKRCHDVGRSGWMQIVPFYVFWLLFKNGDFNRNEYGPNPKFSGEDVLESETLDEHLRN